MVVQLLAACLIATCVSLTLVLISFSF